jgi:hypothetical protein
LKSRVSWSIFLRLNFEASMVRSDFSDMIGSIDKQCTNAWNKYTKRETYNALLLIRRKVT